MALLTTQYLRHCLYISLKEKYLYVSFYMQNLICFKSKNKKPACLAYYGEFNEIMISHRDTKHIFFFSSRNVIMDEMKQDCLKLQWFQ